MAQYRVFVCGDSPTWKDTHRGDIRSHWMSWDAETRERVAACPQESRHFYGPPGYVSWHEWAERMDKTHRQIRCECGLYLLLAAKTKEPA